MNSQNIDKNCLKSFLKNNVYPFLGIEIPINRNTWSTKCNVKTSKLAPYCIQASARITI